jgi:hypothetical protein
VKLRESNHTLCKSGSSIPLTPIDTNVIKSQSQEIVSWSDNFYQDTYEHYNECWVTNLFSQNHPTYTQTDLSYTQILQSNEKRKSKRPKLDEILESSTKINRQFEQLCNLYLLFFDLNSSFSSSFIRGKLFP